MENIESINKKGQKEGRETNDFEDLELPTNIPRSYRLVSSFTYVCNTYAHLSMSIGIL